MAFLSLKSYLKSIKKEFSPILLRVNQLVDVKIVESKKYIERKSPLVPYTIIE